jgi:hypothetical protein
MNEGSHFDMTQHAALPHDIQDGQLNACSTIGCKNDFKHNNKEQFNSISRADCQ